MGLDVVDEPAAAATSPESRRVRFGSQDPAGARDGKAPALGTPPGLTVASPRSGPTFKRRRPRNLQLAVEYSGEAGAAADAAERAGGPASPEKAPARAAVDDELAAALASQVSRGLQLLCGSPKATSLSAMSGKRSLSRASRGSSRPRPLHQPDAPASMKGFLRKYQRARDAGDVGRRDAAADLLAYSRQLLSHLGPRGVRPHLQAHPAAQGAYLPVAEAARQLFALRELLAAAEAELETEPSPTEAAAPPPAQGFHRFQVASLKRRIAELELLALLPSAAAALPPPTLAVSPAAEADGALLARTQTCVAVRRRPDPLAAAAEEEEEAEDSTDAVQLQALLPFEEAAKPGGWHFLSVNVALKARLRRARYSLREAALAALQRTVELGRMRPHFAAWRLGALAKRNHRRLLLRRGLRAFQANVNTHDRLVMQMRTGRRSLVDAVRVARCFVVWRRLATVHDCARRWKAPPPFAEYFWWTRLVESWTPAKRISLLQGNLRLCHWRVRRILHQWHRYTLRRRQKKQLRAKAVAHNTRQETRRWFWGWLAKHQRIKSEQHHHRHWVALCFRALRWEAQCNALNRRWAPPRRAALVRDNFKKWRAVFLARADSQAVCVVRLQMKRRRVLGACHAMQDAPANRMFLLYLRVFRHWLKYVVWRKQLRDMELDSDQEYFVSLNPNDDDLDARDTGSSDSPSYGSTSRRHGRTGRGKRFDDSDSASSYSQAYSGNQGRMLSHRTANSQQTSRSASRGVSHVMSGLLSEASNALTTRSRGTNLFSDSAPSSRLPPRSSRQGTHLTTSRTLSRHDTRMASHRSKVLTSARFTARGTEEPESSRRIPTHLATSRSTARQATRIATHRSKGLTTARFTARETDDYETGSAWDQTDASESALHTSRSQATSRGGGDGILTHRSGVSARQRGPRTHRGRPPRSEAERSRHHRPRRWDPAGPEFLLSADQRVAFIVTFQRRAQLQWAEFLERFAAVERRLQIKKHVRVLDRYYKNFAETTDASVQFSSYALKAMPGPEGGDVSRPFVLCSGCFIFSKHVLPHNARRVLGLVGLQLQALAGAATPATGSVAPTPAGGSARSAAPSAAGSARRPREGSARQWYRPEGDADARLPPGLAYPAEDAEPSGLILDPAIQALKEHMQHHQGEEEAEEAVDTAPSAASIQRRLLAANLEVRQEAKQLAAEVAVLDSTREATRAQTDWAVDTTAKISEELALEPPLSASSLEAFEWRKEDGLELDRGYSADFEQFRFGTDATEGDEGEAAPAERAEGDVAALAAGGSPAAVDGEDRRLSVQPEPDAVLGSKAGSAATLASPTPAPAPAAAAPVPSTENEVAPEGKGKPRLGVVGLVAETAKDVTPPGAAKGKGRPARPGQAQPAPAGKPARGKKPALPSWAATPKSPARGSKPKPKKGDIWTRKRRKKPEALPAPPAGVAPPEPRPPVFIPPLRLPKPPDPPLELADLWRSLEDLSYTSSSIEDWDSDSDSHDSVAVPFSVPTSPLSGASAGATEPTPTSPAASAGTTPPPAARRPARPRPADPTRPARTRAAGELPPPVPAVPMEAAATPATAVAAEDGAAVPAAPEPKVPPVPAPAAAGPPAIRTEVEAEAVAVVVSRPVVEAADAETQTDPYEDAEEATPTPAVAVPLLTVDTEETPAVTEPDDGDDAAKKPVRPVIPLLSVVDLKFPRSASSSAATAAAPLTPAPGSEAPPSCRSIATSPREPFVAAPLQPERAGRARAGSRLFAFSRMRGLGKLEPQSPDNRFPVDPVIHWTGLHTSTHDFSFQIPKLDVDIHPHVSGVRPYPRAAADTTGRGEDAADELGLPRPPRQGFSGGIAQPFQEYYRPPPERELLHMTDGSSIHFPLTKTFEYRELNEYLVEATVLYTVNEQQVRYGAPPSLTLPPPQCPTLAADLPHARPATQRRIPAKQYPASPTLLRRIRESARQHQYVYEVPDSPSRRSSGPRPSLDDVTLEASRVKMRSRPTFRARRSLPAKTIELVGSPKSLYALPAQ